ncbi:hypothetical protein Misp02_45270 [Microtetraspora sp. NBRC 16547]|nr:hypothetical protein Misp02_45270 [Microtetraspora sp. NBRC 16547]
MDMVQDKKNSPSESRCPRPQSRLTAAAEGLTTALDLNAWRHHEKTMRDGMFQHTLSFDRERLPDSV